MLLKMGFLLYLVGLIGLFFASRGKYSKLSKDLDDKKYPLRGFICMGHWIMLILCYQYKTVYDQKLTILFNQIYGIKEGKEYTKIHWANQVTLALLVILFLFFFAITMEEVEGSYIIVSLVSLIAVLYGLNKDVHQQLKDRQLSIRLDFIEFLSKLVLLVNAGLNVSKAWEKIVVESSKDGPLYNELRITLSEIKNGKSEEEAYEDFANRCRTPEIFKFVSLIIQNIKKGNEEIVFMLRLLTNECWEMRKITAKILGEEASTRLLLPMMIMFVAILAIVMTPAILALTMM